MEATQNYPGLYKFRTRILEPGHDYYIRVAGNHPAYQLHTSEFPVPPYADPHQAVRAGMDFLVNMGDSWLSNTPRRGSVALRTTMQHSETQLCIACHPAQFTTRGYLTAVKNGYAPKPAPAARIPGRPPLQQRPSFIWRTEHQLGPRDLHRAHRIEPAPAAHQPIRAKRNPRQAKAKLLTCLTPTTLKIHYKNLKEMPGDEADGCEPDVSPFEIATQSWQTFDMVYKQTKDQTVAQPSVTT